MLDGVATLTLIQMHETCHIELELVLSLIFRNVGVIKEKQYLIKNT